MYVLFLFLRNNTFLRNIFFYSSIILNIMLILRCRTVVTKCTVKAFCDVKVTGSKNPSMLKVQNIKLIFYVKNINTKYQT
jgi:hypothetical protein